VAYVDVLADTAQLDRMLKYSGGTRKVPVIVDQKDVVIGFKGKG
jgi:arsenate reductase-like glutaredoxin family protein